MARKSQADIFLILIALVVGVIVMILSAVAKAVSELSSVAYTARVPIIVSAIVLFCLFLSYLIYDYFYFRSKKFKSIKNSIQKYIDNCNEMNHHIEELKGAYVSIKSYDYGVSSIKDESNYNFKRLEWSKSIKNNFTHNCSLSVYRNANDQPLKYLCKYFDIELSEESLINIESVLNDFAAAEQGKNLLQKENEAVLGDIKSLIPWLILNFSKKKLIRKLGFEEVDMSDLYFPLYTFLYVSAGGNSSMKCDIKLNIENLENLISYIRRLIKFRQSIQGQRALMTTKLRELIKERDNYKCQLCGLSTDDERNLLLEIDHITPLSKGGVTSEDNLQTLCWKCNRTKGSKIYPTQILQNNT